MVPSNQRLFPDSLADIQNGSSYVGYFHTKSKTLCEIEDVSVGDCEQSIHCTSEGIDLLVGVPYKDLPTWLRQNYIHDSWGTVLGLIHKDGVKRGKQRFAQLPEFQIAIMCHLVCLFFAFPQLPHVVPESACFKDTILKSK